MTSYFAALALTLADVPVPEKSNAAMERPPNVDRLSVTVPPLVSAAVTIPDAVLWPIRARPALASRVTLVEPTSVAVPNA